MKPIRSPSSSRSRRKYKFCATIILKVVERCLYHNVIFQAILVEIAIDDFTTQSQLQIFHIDSFKCNRKQMLVCRNGLLINSNTVYLSIIPTKILNVQYIECL
ncbi:unnamed protein product [Schistosoma guineensis]|nr:unnamed protein product [Schistosoma guineensis]